MRTPMQDDAMFVCIGVRVYVLPCREIRRVIKRLYEFSSSNVRTTSDDTLPHTTPLPRTAHTGWGHT